MFGTQKQYINGTMDNIFQKMKSSVTYLVLPVSRAQQPLCRICPTCAKALGLTSTGLNQKGQLQKYCGICEKVTVALSFFISLLNGVLCYLWAFIYVRYVRTVKDFA